MINIIPAWHQAQKWCEQEQAWYHIDQKTEFDDSVKQMQLFHRSHMVDYNIIQLAYAPNFRHFLHRQSVLRAPYWSCFDAIQEVKRKKPALLSYLNIDWPKGVEFIFSPFAVIVYLQQQKYAKVEMGKDGNPIRIDMFDQNKICRSNIYDDRGFLSSTIVYQEGEPEYQEYLSESGIWKIRQDLRTGRVFVNEKCPTYTLCPKEEMLQYSFLKEEYANIEEIVQEVFGAYLQLQNPKDIYCIAVELLSVQLLSKCLEGKNVIASFYESRYRLSSEDTLLLYGLMKNVGFCISDSEAEIREIKKVFSNVVDHIQFISPYDTRIDLGISQQLQVQKLLLPVDDLDMAVLDVLIQQLGEYVHKVENIEVHLFTRNPDPNGKKKLLERVRELVGEEQMILSTDEVGELEADQEAKPLFYVEQCIDEMTCSKCMKEQRLLIDLRNKPEQYLQVLAVSMGIPQIVCEENRYVEHLKNGLVLSKMEDLHIALDYYLKGFVNWNQAMIYSYEIGKRNTTEVLLRLWKEVILSFE